MKKAILIWQIPVLSGEKYAPMQYAMYHKSAEQFQQSFQEYFKMDWEIELDETAADFEKLKDHRADLYIFVPGAKTRCWMYKDQIEKLDVPLYYLESSEYQSKNIEKIRKFILELS